MYDDGREGVVLGFSGEEHEWDFERLIMVEELGCVGVFGKLSDAQDVCCAMELKVHRAAIEVVVAMASVGFAQKEKAPLEPSSAQMTNGM